MTLLIEYIGSSNDEPAWPNLSNTSVEGGEEVGNPDQNDGVCISPTQTTPTNIVLSTRMAWAHCALSSFPPSTNTVVAKKTLDTASSLPPLKLTKRKNYLRTKLLKTLTKPYPSPLLPQENTEEEQLIRKLSETLEIQQEEEEFEISSGRNVGDSSSGGPYLEEEEEGKNEQTELDSCNLRVSNNAGAGVSESAGVFSTRSILELVLYIVGIFVLQTVCAVWIFGSVHSDKKSGNEEKEADLGILRSEMVNEKKKGDFFFNLMGNVSGKIIGSKPGGFINVDKPQLEESIVKIRVMAREARESEAKKLSTNGLGSSSDGIGIDGDDIVPKVAVSRVKTNIQKEVDGRLSKLEKRLHSLREKSPALSVS
ncbi:hypothetical protein BVC80_8537g3 [Macleaya cordata]|uniref:Transmembrane protein n=1 Tax=Macleaya cordata TaxID=56857 RepID=A0A200PMH8_MACCD|nr:hypothetical protein BVC80_8537g3 [Macleaya cordata]